MPDVQLSFDGDTPHTCQDAVRDPLDTTYCEGGCERDVPRSDLHPTPDGLMCQRCLADLYRACNDCSRLMRLNSWGECDESCQGADGVERCCECHEAGYSRCCRCGRFTPRQDENIRTDPNASDREYCGECWESQWFTCVDCEEISSRHDGMTTPDHRRLCVGCFEANYVACANCGAAMTEDSYLGWEGDPHCERCYGNADTWLVQPWSGQATSFDRVGSTRRFGVELETNDCACYRDLHGHTEWGCVYECSTSGQEFISPILQGDEGFASIAEICSFASRHDWTVDSGCGLHIHLDLSEETSEECLSIAYAYRRTYPLWKKFISNRRAGNSMCGSPQYSSADVRAAEHIDDFVEARDRFEFVNWRAYLRHGSFEVRMYKGSLTTREVCNWVALHARFLDRVKGMSFDELDSTLGAITRRNWAGLCELIDDADLLDYWRRKARRIGNELPALWEDTEEGDEEENCGIVVGEDSITVPELLVTNGDADLVELANGRFYETEYDAVARAYILRFPRDRQAEDRVHREAAEVAFPCDRAGVGDVLIDVTPSDRALPPASWLDVRGDPVSGDESNPLRPLSQVCARAVRTSLRGHTRHE